MAGERDKIAVEDEPPWSDGITDYDRAHLAIYLRLLDAANANANPADMARTILGLDPASDHDRALRAVSSHLRRARWVSHSGYRHLLKG